MSTLPTPLSPSRPKTVRARRVWLNVFGAFTLSKPPKGMGGPTPYRWIDVSDEAALVEQVARALYVDFNGKPESFPLACGEVTAKSFRGRARAALRSLGIIGGRGK